MTDVELITMRYGETKKKTEEHKAADIVEQFFNAGLSFEASKQVISDLTSFHGRTIGNVEKALNASRFYHALARGHAESTPSGQVLAHLYKWLYLKKKRDEKFTSVEWAEEMFKATVWAGDALSRERFFDADAKPKALKDRRGRLLSNLVGLGERTTTRQNEERTDQYSITSLPRFSYTHFRDDLSFIAVGCCDASKITINIKKKKDFTCVNPSNLEEESHSQSEFNRNLSETNDNVSDWVFDDDSSDAVLDRLSDYMRYK